MEEKETTVKILDTNVLLDYPQIITTSSEYWIIPICVLKEIDGLKVHKNPETAHKARKAAVYISKNTDNIEFFDDTDMYEDTVDEKLITITKEYGGILVTNDVALKVICNIKGVQTEGYSWQGDYTGAIRLDVANMSIDDYSAMLTEIMEGDIENSVYLSDYDFYENEYLIVPPPCDDASLGSQSIFRYDGIHFVPVKIREIKNRWIEKITPRNPEQICLVDMLLNKTPIVYAGGKFGTGKSYLTYNYTIGELEADRIKKIVYIPNNAYTRDSMEIGALPGDVMDKITPSIGPLIDLVGIDQVNRWISEEKLEIVPLAYIRGRSFDDSIIIVSEAENLTEDHIKLLLGRCGKDTRIFFDGDIKQADSAIFKDRNGLKLLLNLHQNPVFAKLFGTIQLNRIERSIVAAAADYLDSI